MFIEAGVSVRATDEDGRTYTGQVYKIVIQNDNNDNKPHALVFISQDKHFVEREGDFGCASLWVDRLRKIETICYKEK